LGSSSISLARSGIPDVGTRSDPASGTMGPGLGGPVDSPLLCAAFDMSLAQLMFGASSADLAELRL